MHRREVEDIVALDVALRRNDREWVEQLPQDVERDVVHKLYYGHFFAMCSWDYIVKKGVDPLAMEHRMGAAGRAPRRIPAEHNVGHLYVAKPALAGFYQSLDPTNTFNPRHRPHPRGRNWQGATTPAAAQPQGPALSRLIPKRLTPRPGWGPSTEAGPAAAPGA